MIYKWAEAQQINKITCAPIKDSGLIIHSVGSVVAVCKKKEQTFWVTAEIRRPW